MSPSSKVKFPSFVYPWLSVVFLLASAFTNPFTAKGWPLFFIALPLISIGFAILGLRDKSGMIGKFGRTACWILLVIASLFTLYSFIGFALVLGAFAMVMGSH